MSEDNKALVIGVDYELIKVLKRLEAKLKKVAWDGIDKVSYRDLTKILAKKINELKII